jgi:hypothetical protein
MKIDLDLDLAYSVVMRGVMLWHQYGELNNYLALEALNYHNLPSQ